MSSLKMTFSLTSLIFLIALGLVFVPTSVMAHGPGVTPAATPETHEHPVNTAIEDDPDTTATESVATHNQHPMVTSVVLKEAEDKTRGNMVVVTDPAAGAAADAVFTLVVTFDRDIVPANNLRVAPTSEADRTAEADLVADGDFTDVILNVDGTTNTTAAIAFADAGRVENSNNSVEVSATVSAAFPTGTDEANDKEFTLRFRVNANAVFSLETFPEFTAVPGGNSLASRMFEFKLVNSLPAETMPDDEEPPTVTVKRKGNSPTKMPTGGKVEFTIEFNEPLGTEFNGFALDDVTITGGDATADDLMGPTPETAAANGDVPQTYTLMVTPDSADGEVMVTVGRQIADVAGNPIDPTDTTNNVFSDSIVLDSTPPTAVNHTSAPLLTPPAGASAGTYLSFTLTFSEPVKNLSVDSIDEGQSHNAGFDTRYFGPTLPTGAAVTDDTLSTVWIVTVDVPDPDSVTSIRLKIGTGAVMDAAGNDLARSYTASNTLANTHPYFVGTMANIGICEGDTLPASGEDVKVLPLAADLDKPAQRLDYDITPDLPTGLFVEPIDHQRRAIKGTTTVVGTTTHTWQVTDQYGLMDETPVTFTITVKAHQEPEKPMRLMATKVDSASIEMPTHDRVTLTWPQAADKSAYPDCIPPVTSYTVSQTKKDEVTDTYPASSLVTYSSMTGQMYAESFMKPTGAGNWSFTTPELHHGIYKFTIVAHNAAGASDASDAAVWDKTMLMEVVVADPPAEPKQLEGAIDQDGNQVTLNWLKVPDAMDNGAPIDDLGVYKANTRYGGYVIYQVRDEDDQVTRYPATGTLEIADYEHPTWQTPNLEPGQYVFRVTAMNIAGESPRSNATREFTIVSSGTRPPVLPPVTSTSATYSNGVTTIGTGQMIAPNGFYVIPANALPDIHRFFAEGGTISVLGATGAEAKSVVISEIMWGRNLRQAVGAGRKAEQFIELYNTSTATINLSTVTLVFDSTNAVPAVPTGKVLLDQISNVSGIGWLITEAPGQDGSLAEPGDPNTFVSVNLVSMYRNINYDNVTKTHNADDAAKNRTEQLKAVPDGNNLGNWAASNDADTYGLNRIGSPGAEHFVAYVRLTRTDVKRDQFIINEIGNYRDDKYDWVEIKRVGTNDNLKKWRLSQVTDKADTALVTFPDNDNHKIPNQNDVLLIVNSDPYQNPEHPLAAGDRINGGHVEKTGTTSRYYVDSGLKLKNDGKTLLILRNSNDNGHLGKSNNIQDVVGTLGITDNSAGFRTNLWPLVATGAPHGNVIDGTDDEDFRSGKVYRRANAGGGTGEKHIAVVGYTGVGYKRSAAKSGQHGGTPGYDNGAVKVNETDLANATVSISEIMYTKGRNLPQWIELYNSSMTQAVNLGEWKLRIEHSRDVEDVDIRYPSVTTNNLGGVIIPPNQTVLLVSSTTGRTSRAAQGSVDFPASRIIDIWGHKDRLEVPSTETRRTYKLLSETAFKITLLDKSNAAVDIAGNLGADGTAMWELPSNGAEGRSSIIRRYNEGSTTRGGAGEAVDGTMSVWNGGGADGMKGSAGWIYAAASDLGEVRANETYYGSPDDHGTPGFRGGGPLPVSLSKFRPERLDTGEIVVRWTTESELNNAGFNILRSETRNGEFTQINTSLIAGQGTTSERTAYEWKDSTAKPNVVYYYQIQDVSLDGNVQTLRMSRLKGNVSAAGKLTTTWGELKALQ